ncbi:MAG: HD domain-containing protein [Methylotenera sp.]|nr:HD domain-containing protein [Methylotenera sp.]
MDRNQYKKKSDSTKKKSFILSVISELLKSDAKAKQDQTDKLKKVQQQDSSSFLSDIISHVVEKIEVVRHFKFPKFTLPTFKSKSKVERGEDQKKQTPYEDMAIILEENTAKKIKPEPVPAKIIASQSDTHRTAFKFSIFNFSLKTLFKSQEKNQQKFQPNATLKIATMPEPVTEVFVRQDLIYQARSRRARDKFSDDALVTDEVVKHEVSSHLTDEYASAKIVKSKLNKTVNHRLLDDVSNAEAFNLVLNETQESVGDIVESMIRNPDAMQLVNSIRDYDDLSYKHAVDVCVLMIAFGRELNLPKSTLVELGMGGLLHDIGEVKPPDSNHQRVRNIAMYKIYRSHVEDGIALLQGSNHSEIVKAIVAEHHERVDGNGYPNGLCNIERKSFGHNFPQEQKKKISMYGLMVGIVDTYVSLVSGRGSKVMVAPSVAMTYIVSKAGRDFDASLCDVFAQVIGVYPVGGYVELDTGEVALVIKQNRVWRLKPVIQIVMNKDKKPIEPFYLDLMKQTGSRAIQKEVVFDNPALH